MRQVTNQNHKKKKIQQFKMALQTSSAMFPNSPLSQQYMGLSPDKILYKYTLKCRLRSLFYL